MKNSKHFLPILITLVVMSAALAVSAQNPQPQTNSAPSSPTSGTRVSERNAGDARVSSPHVSKGSAEQKIDSKLLSASPDMQKPARQQGRSVQVDDIALSNVRASTPDAELKVRSNDRIFAACSAAADELIASRTLIDALEKENAALKARQQTDQQMIDLLSELNGTRKAETEALRSALAAKNDALTAKDAVIASQDKLIQTLKRKKSSPWKRIGDVLIGIGIGVLL